MTNLHVLTRRLDALADGIRVRAPYADLKFLLDNVRSAIERGTRDDPYDGWQIDVPGVELLKQAASETDTFRFIIENTHPEDKGRTVSRDALDATGGEMAAWIAVRIVQQWEATGVAPKFISVDVKVGME